MSSLIARVERTTGIPHRIIPPTPIAATIPKMMLTIFPVTKPLFYELTEDLLMLMLFTLEAVLPEFELLV